MMEDSTPRCKDCRHADKLLNHAGYIFCVQGYGLQFKGRAACCEFAYKVQDDEFTLH